VIKSGETSAGREKKPAKNAQKDKDARRTKRQSTIGGGYRLVNNFGRYPEVY
jgi:hypothetical protein